MATSNDLNISQAGYVAFDGTSVFTGRTFQQGTGISILNASGVSGNTTISTNGSQVANTITGNDGVALSPSSGNWNILGTGSLTTTGTGSTLTNQLTGLTNHAVLIGAGTATITKVGPTATAGQVLQSAGASADPAFSTATYPSTATSAGQLLVADGTNWVARTAIMGFFGDGSDSTQTFDGSSVVLGITPSGNAYTLNRDIFLASSTINNGVSIISRGFKIFCNGTLTNNGTILWNGNAGTNTGVAGTALNNSNSSIQNSTGTSSPGSAGGAGNTGAGSPGVVSTFDTFGGAGGNGGNGGSGGGSAGTPVSLTPKNGSIRFLPAAVMGLQSLPNTGWISIGSGTGGGGGGGDGVNKGGGGGSGAGIVIVSSFLISGTGSIQALGGNGGNGAVGATNVGGGGGGGGGVVIIISRSVVAGAVSGQTVSVAGGTHGAGVGSGINGSDGSPGTTVFLPM